MRMFQFVATLALGIAAISGPIARAGVITTPASLNTGDQFRVVFVTSDVLDALSSNILVYDNFVTAAATAGGLTTYNGSAVTWQVIGTTASVSALSRLPTSSPGLYLADGTKVADSGADLWDGSIDAAISRTEMGGTLLSTDDEVWTGSGAGGTFGGANGKLGQGFPIFGSSNASTSEWMLESRTVPNTAKHFYGFSSVLTVPQVAAVPEPPQPLNPPTPSI